MFFKDTIINVDLYRKQVKSTTKQVTEYVVYIINIFTTRLSMIAYLFLVTILRVIVLKEGNLSKKLWKLWALQEPQNTKNKPDKLIKIKYKSLQTPKSSYKYIMELAGNVDFYCANIIS